MADVENIIIALGFDEEERSQLRNAISSNYELYFYKDAFDGVVLNSFCTIVNSEFLDAASMDELMFNCDEYQKLMSDTVIWVGKAHLSDKLREHFICVNNFVTLLPMLDQVISEAQKRFLVLEMYFTPYGYLSVHETEEMLEKDLESIIHKKYREKTDVEILKRFRQEWTAILEVDAITELAAVYEFAAWLKHNKHPYRLGGTAVCGMIPYLLGINDVNPLPPHLYCPECQKVIWRDDYRDGFDIPPEVCPNCGGLMQGDGHNLVWQEYASYGRVPTYVFYLPCDMKPLISDWLDSHWLRKYMGDQWEAAQPYEDHLARGNMLFRFELDRNEIFPDFYSINVGANSKADLIQMATQDEYYHRNPYPKDMGELLTQLGFRKTIWKEAEVARNILLQNKISWRNIPSCREEVFFYLKEHDFIDKDAFRGMNSVRKGKGLPVVTEDMRTAEDHWKAKYFNQIEWMPSKAMLLHKLFFELKK